MVTQIILNHMMGSYLGKWQTRNVVTVQRRIVELDRLFLSD